MSLITQLEQSNSPNSFNKKNIYDATKNLVSLRSQNYKKKEQNADDDDPWKIKPIDFAWHLYQPKPPKRY